MSVTMLPSKKLATEFELEHFYGAGQRGLRHVALLRCAREVQFIGNRKKIADLVHLHGSAPTCRDVRAAISYLATIVALWWIIRHLSYSTRTVTIRSVLLPKRSETDDDSHDFTRHWSDADILSLFQSLKLAR